MKHIKTIDEQGVHLQGIYERRARELMKKGRAYYMTASRICLFTPPENMEEKALEASNKKDILIRIDTILQQKKYLQEVFSAIGKIPHDLNEELTVIRMKTILEIVEAKEETNQEVTALLYAMLGQDAIPRGK